MRNVHIVLPNDIDDPAAPSGGNVYDRRIIDGLATSGWSIHEHSLRGTWPKPDAAARAGLARVLAGLPDESVVLIDSLVSSAVDVAQARRLRLVILVHMPLEDEHERRLLPEVAAIITTSLWSRQRLLNLYGLPADRVHVAAPGVDTAPLAAGSASGSRLLCVAAVAPHKGHDLLVEALAKINDLPWSCTCVGPHDGDFVSRLRRQAEGYGIADRVSFLGPRTGLPLEAEYASADLLVLASRGETYGMVVTEALARGTPVLATAVNGLPEALGCAPSGSLPGILVPPEDPAALADALRRWLSMPPLRVHLRHSARERRTALTGWAVTSSLVATVLSGASAHLRVRR